MIVYFVRYIWYTKLTHFPHANTQITCSNCIQLIVMATYMFLCTSVTINYVSALQMSAAFETAVLSQVIELNFFNK